MNLLKRNILLILLILLVSSGCNLLNPANSSSSSSSSISSSSSGSSIGSSSFSSTGSSKAPFITAQVIINANSGVFLTEQVSVFSDSNHGTPITNDTVTINGVNIPWSVNKGFYQVNNVNSLTGNLITVDVLDSGIHYTVTGTNFTSFLTVSTPVSNAIWYFNTTYQLQCLVFRNKWGKCL